jgi:hypothetical protein
MFNFINEKRLNSHTAKAVARMEKQLRDDFKSQLGQVRRDNEYNLDQLARNTARIISALSEASGFKFDLETISFLPRPKTKTK